MALVVAFQVRAYLHICVFMIAGHRLSMETLFNYLSVRIAGIWVFQCIVQTGVIFKKSLLQHPELTLVNWVEVLTQPPRLNV